MNQDTLRTLLSRLTDRQLIAVGVAAQAQRGRGGRFGADSARMSKSDKVTFLTSQAIAAGDMERLAALANNALTGAPIAYQPRPDGAGEGENDRAEWLEEAARDAVAAKAQERRMEDAAQAAKAQEQAEEAAAQAGQARDGDANFENPNDGDGDGQDGQDDENDEAAKRAEAQEQAEALLGKPIAEAVAAIAGNLDAEALGAIATALQARIDAAVPVEAPAPVVVLPQAQAGPVIDMTGKHPIFPKLLSLCMLPRGERPNILLVGPAGSGKTTICRHVAEHLNRSFGEISLSGGTTETSLLGRVYPSLNDRPYYVAAPFATSYEEGGVFCVDEVDAADPNTLLVLNSALANGGMSIEARAAGGLHPHIVRHDDNLILACANTYGGGADAQYVGRTQLDAAFLDRFLILSMDYDANLLRQLTGRSAKRAAAWSPKADPATLQTDLQALGDWLDGIAAKAVKAGLQRIVGTRAYQKARAMRLASWTVAEAQETILAGWSADEKAAVA